MKTALIHKACWLFFGIICMACQPQKTTSEKADVAVGLETISWTKDAYQLNWRALAAVNFEEKYIDSLKTTAQVALFSTGLTALDGQQVQLTGYLFPLDEGLYVLSAKPFANCFFCGQAGPETVVELNPAHSLQSFEMDDFIAVKGTFRLNNADQNRLYYIVEEATVVP